MYTNLNKTPDPLSSHIITLIKQRNQISKQFCIIRMPEIQKNLKRAYKFIKSEEFKFKTSATNRKYGSDFYKATELLRNIILSPTHTKQADCANK